MRPTGSSAPPRARRGLSLTGTATLVAVVAVLVLVSLPRLRSFALRANEREALSTARLLANASRELADPDSAPIAAVLALDDVRRRLPDAELLEDGHLLRHHGYLFQLVRMAPRDLPGAATLAAGGEPYRVVRAWPWLYGQTGAAALLALPGGMVLAHTNDGPLWSGPGRPPGVAGGLGPAPAAWFRVR